MDNSLHLRLEEMPSREALEDKKREIQDELVKEGSRIAKLHWGLARDTALDGLKTCLDKLDPIALPPLRFTLVLKAAVESAILIVRGGKLHSIEGGRMKPSATLSYGDRELRHFDCDPIDIKPPHVFADGGLNIPL